MKIVHKIKTDKLLKNTIILSIASVLIGAINYFTHPVLARIMDVKTYGEFETLFALIYIGIVPAATITTIVKRYTSNYLSKNEVSKIQALFKVCLKIVTIFGLILIVLLTLGSGYIASFLQFNSKVPIIMLSFTLGLSFLSAANNGILHGYQKFISFSYNNLAGAISKVVFVSILAYVGFGINGAVTGLALASLLTCIYSGYQIKFVFKHKKTGAPHLDTKELMLYSIPTFFILLCFNSLYNLDIILVKHYLSPETSGLYAAMTTTGRLIFFVTGAITLAMFPIASSTHANDGNSSKILLNSLLLLVSVSVGFLLAFFLLPELMIKILIGNKFIQIKDYLGWFGITMLLLSIINLLTQYLLSIGKTHFVYFFSLGPILMISLIYHFHESLWQIIWIMTGTFSFLTIGLMIFVLSSRKIKNNALNVQASTTL